VAVLKEGLTLGAAPMSQQQRTAQTLAPAVVDLLDQVGWQPSDIELIAVTQGPGSFTGLRIGITTAKTLAYALSAQVIGVNTLEAIAAQTDCNDQPFWVVMDAQREELFATLLKADENGRWLTAEPTHIVKNDAWLQQLKPGDFVCGSGLKKLVDRLPADVEVIDSTLWNPRAEIIGQLGWQQHQAGRRDDLWKLVPQYYRLSYAEEKAVQKES